MCEMTTTAVGAEFGNRNHSTVSTSYKKVQKMIQEDRAVTEDLAAQMTDARTVGCTEFGEIITKLL